MANISSPVTVQIADLPIIPCYKSEECGKKFQCGTSKCNPSDTSCPSGSGFSGECWGWDINYCDGILSCCDHTKSKFECKQGIFDPAVSVRDKTLGCKIGNSSEQEVGTCTRVPNQTNDICMEFNNDADSNTETCQTNCWENGGRYLTYYDCKNLFKNESQCNAMPYFCSWDTRSKSCISVKDDPYISFIENFNSPPPKDSVTYTVVKNCSSLGLTHGLNCIESDTLLTSSTATVTCSQSAWDSSKTTSYDPRTRICCLETCDIKNPATCSKKCIATHRCQYVDKTTDCSIKTTSSSQDTEKSKFMCADIVFRNTSGGVTGGQITQGAGYCTWCQNQSSHPQDNPPKTPEGFIQREPTEWLDSPGGNRCSTYNQCEYNNSEELWNECMYKKLPNMAVNPSDLLGLTNDEKTKILQEKGFCLQADAPQNVWDAVKACESELSYMGSISGGPLISPGGLGVKQCSYSYTWKHVCQPSTLSGQVPQLAQNYLCTWCPSLICKQGSSSKICSNIDSLKTCTTSDTFGEIINPSKWESDCGCFANKEGEVLTPDTKAGLVGGTVGTASVAALIALIVIELL